MSANDALHKIREPSFRFAIVQSKEPEFPVVSTVFGTIAFRVVTTYRQ
jgi:hypothetical protein